jgi:hypothetical protein
VSPRRPSSIELGLHIQVVSLLDETQFPNYPIFPRLVLTE